jgi:hypothetical protein
MEIHFNRRVRSKKGAGPEGSGPPTAVSPNRVWLVHEHDAAGLDIRLDFHGASPLVVSKSATQLGIHSLTRKNGAKAITGFGGRLAQG